MEYHLKKLIDNVGTRKKYIIPLWMRYKYQTTLRRRSYDVINILAIFKNIIGNVET